jgi:NAD(P)-dependent dehydrogenase (short-subunit alcohol dehydrogenase family)
VNILINNAGVGLRQSASQGTLNDWEWGMGVNFWGPVYGVNTFVPRMLASKQGCHIVTTTSTSGIVPNNGAGIYTVSKFAAVALMEELRGELGATNIGTSCFVPGNTSTNIAQSESHRPEELKNDESATAATQAGGPPRRAGGPPAARPTPPAPPSPYWARPQDPVVVGRVVLDGILHNDLFIVLQPEWAPGVELRMKALLESMVPITPMPDSLKGRDYSRTPVYAQEIAHRIATRKRTISGI